MCSRSASRLSRWVVCVAVALGLTCRAALVFGQGTGQLRIKVVDQTGGALVNATVEITAAGASTPVPGADDSGSYSLKDVQPGRYALTVEAEGFVPAKKTIDVRASRVTNLTVALTVHAEEDVEVRGLRSPLPNSITSLTFTRKDLDLLLPNNDLEMLYRLQALAGSRGVPGDVAIYVDGFSDFRRLPPKSAIDLIQINAEPYSAEFPEPGARRIEIVTKPGGDGVFGEFKSDFNDQNLNAREPLATSKPVVQRNTLSGYFSAPIIPQRWGFYAYTGRWEQDDTAVIHATTLNDALQPAAFAQTLASPQQLNNYTANTGFALGNGSRLKAEFSRDTTSARNQGLTSGFDLPERGFSSRNTTDAGRFSLLSVLGKSAVFETRVQLKRDATELRGNSGATAIIVLNAFDSGANQNALFKDTTNRSLQVDVKLTKAMGANTLRLGFEGNRFNLSQVDYSNFGGTFVFGGDVQRDQAGAPIVTSSGGTIPISPLDSYSLTLAGVTGYRPTLFTITTGVPSAVVGQTQLAGFVQDDWLRSKSLTVSTGLRYEWQSDLSGRRDFAPRIGMAWSLGDNGGIIRAGSGFFYKRFDPALTLSTVQFDGRHQQQYVFQAPTFKPPPSFNQAEEPPAIVTMADGLKAGRMSVANVSYERSILKRLFGSVTYTYERGDNLTRTDDVNAPLVAGGPRPIADMGQVLAFQSSGGSRRHQLQMGLRASLNSGTMILANYTIGVSRSNTDSPQTIPGDSHNLTNEWGPAATDERQRLYVNGTVMMPHFFMLIPSFTYATPRPFNITTGLDNNLDGHLTDRPSFATPGDATAIATPWGLLNPLPKPGETSIPRNFGRGDRLLKFDLSFAKIFMLANPLKAQRALALTVSAQNLLNTVNLQDYNGVLLSPLFGQPNTAGFARRITVGLSLDF